MNFPKRKKGASAIAVRVEPEVHAKLFEIATREESSVSGVVKTLIAFGIEEYEKNKTR